MRLPLTTSLIPPNEGTRSSPPIRSRTHASAKQAPVLCVLSSRFTSMIDLIFLTIDLMLTIDLIVYIPDLARATKDIIKYKANLEGYFDAGAAQRLHVSLHCL